MAKDAGKMWAKNPSCVGGGAPPLQIAQGGTWIFLGIFGRGLPYYHHHFVDLQELVAMKFVVWEDRMVIPLMVQKSGDHHPSDVESHVNNGEKTTKLNWLAGFLPSRVFCWMQSSDFFSKLNWWCLPGFWTINSPFTQNTSFTKTLWLHPTGRSWNHWSQQPIPEARHGWHVSMVVSGCWLDGIGWINLDKQTKLSIW